MSTSKELNKVRLEPKRNEEDDGSDSASVAGSEVESAPTDEEYDSSQELRVDAIKWAKYRNSIRDREDGYTGWVSGKWHYGVMWNGYLKTGSETEEPIASFNIEKGKKSLIAQFWEALEMEPAPRKKEPKGKLGMYLETPPALMREWFKENPTKKNGLKYRRNYETYKRRRAKEIKREKLEKDFRTIPEDLFTKKADSDYYLFKKQFRERRRRLRQERESSTESRRNPIRLAKSTRSPTPQSSKASSSKPKTKPKPASLPIPETNTNITVASLGSPDSASTLGSLFDSDREDAGDVEQELQAASEEEEEQIEAPSNAPKSTKRKALSSSPIASTSTQSTEQNKRAKKEERTARLANAGKIAKKVTSPPPPSASSVTFGELQDGIFDFAPSPGPPLPAASSVPPAPSVPSVPMAATLAAAPAAPSSKPSVSTISSATPITAPPVPAAPKPAVNAVQAALAALKAQQTVPTNGPAAQSKQDVPAGPRSPSNLQETLPAASTVLSSPALRIPTPPLPVTSTASNPNINTTTSFSQPQPARPVQNSMGSTGMVNSGASVPSFNPAPVAGTSKPRSVPLSINRPKYKQPSKIKTLDTVDPIQARRLANSSSRDLRPAQNTPTSASLPARPSNAYTPRQTYPPEPYGQMNHHQHQDDDLGGSSPRTDQSPKIPTAPAITVQLPADPRRKAPANSSTGQTSLPTPVTTPIQSTKEVIPVDFSLNPVDITGGLVTFSPTLILGHPGKFINIMKFCMTNPHWGAYLTPAALEFINGAWVNRQICPDATTAYSVLIQFLPLDDQLRGLAGAGITSGGGMSISCCPPSPYQADACVKWKTWLFDVFSTSEYDELVGLCEQYNKQKLGPSFPSIIKNLDVNRIEEMQIDDLKSMKARKGIIDYTRFVYVSDNKKTNTNEGVECLSVDEFIDILQRSNGN